MRLLTLNTHSLVESEYEEKLQSFVQAVARLQPDVIALQEVNQTSPQGKLASQAAKALPEAQTLGRYVNGYEQQPVTADNHVARVAAMLREYGVKYEWTWLPMKLGYGTYDEGLALLSKKPIAQVDVQRLSKASAYTDWRCRYLLGIQLKGSTDWFYSTHLGWWNDEVEPFKDQWQRLELRLLERRQSGRVFLLGDFNSPAEVRREGYDLICSNGWQDTYQLAKVKDNGYTVEGIIDGWRDKLPADGNSMGMRIDQIWCSTPVQVNCSQVCFNGGNEPKVSDHFGILAEIEDR